MEIKILTKEEIKFMRRMNEISVSATGTATDQVKYIKINGVEKKIGGGEEYSEGTGIKISAANAISVDTTTIATVNYVDQSVTGLITESEAQDLIDDAVTYQTTAPTAAITGGVHIVYLSAEPATYYSGYIYLIAE